MKIGYLVPAFPGQTHAFFWREAAAMEEAGAEIRFLSTRRPLLEACPHEFREEAMARTRYLFPPSADAVAALVTRPAKFTRGFFYVARLSQTPIAARTRLFALLPVAMGLLNICRNEGIGHLHIHSCADAAHLGALVRLMGGPSYSLTLHGDLPVYGTDHGAKMAGAAFVSAVTRQLADQIGKIAPNLHRPVIPMGVDCDFFRPPDPPRARQPGDRLEIVTVARLNLTKGHSFTLEAIAALVVEGIDIHYRIIGSGPEEKAIRAKVQRLGLDDRVEFTGALGQVAVRAALDRAHVLTLTSFGQGEAAPVTVMEAMACGLPVVVTKIGGTPDMIEDGVNGYLTTQRDVGEIVTSIRRLAEDPTHADIIGAAARVRAKEAFDFRVNAIKLLAEIEEAHRQTAPLGRTRWPVSN